jgi:hypothetical protein
MLQRFLLIALTLCSLTASAQWQQTGSKVRYVNGLGIPTKDTAAGVAADSSQIVIRPADSSLYIKYKRTWLRVGGGAGGGSIGGSGTTNYVPKFTASGFIGNSQIFDNGTNVGIGTASSSYKLAVVVPSSADRDIFLAGMSGVSNGFTIQRVSSSFVYSMIDGNVGIGTSSPSQKLSVTGGNILQTGANDVSYIYHQTITSALSGGGLWGIEGSTAGSLISGTNPYATVISSTSSGTRLHFGTASFVRATITSGGNFLIGTTTDNGVDNLQVSGSMNVSTLATTNNLSVTTNATVGGNARVSGTLIAGTTADNGIDKLQVYGTSYYTGQIQQRITSPRFYLDDADNAGTASLWFRPVSASYNIRGALELISFGSAAGGELRMSSGASGGGVTASQYQTFYTAGVERVRITSAGRILANTTTDNTVDQLQVNGSILSTQYKLSALNTAPATASSSGTLGEIRIDANYIYICTATNTWKRVAIATW